MPKYRKLHVSSIHSLDIAEMPDDFHRLMWTWLPLISCAGGRGLDMGSWLRGQIFALRTDVTPQMCDQAMSWFEARGMITRYNINGRHYYQIVNWHKYQGDTRREAESMWPAPPQELVAQAGKSRSRVSHELVATRSRSDAEANAKAKADVDADAAATAKASPDAAAAAAFLNQFGLGVNDKTAQLVGLSPDYIRAHLDYAKKRGEGTGLAIHRMINGDPSPDKLDRQIDLTKQIPDEYRDLIKR